MLGEKLVFQLAVGNLECPSLFSLYLSKPSTAFLLALLYRCAGKDVFQLLQLKCGICGATSAVLTRDGGAESN